MSQVTHLEGQLRTLRNAHNTFASEFTFFHGVMEANPVRDVVKDLHLIRSDVNILLASFSGLAVFVDGIQPRLDRVTAYLETLEQTVLNN